MISAMKNKPITIAVLSQDDAWFLSQGERGKLRPFLIAKPQSVHSDEKKIAAINALLVEAGV